VLQYEGSIPIVYVQKHPAQVLRWMLWSAVIYLALHSMIDINRIPALAVIQCIHSAMCRLAAVSAFACRIPFIAIRCFGTRFYRRSLFDGDRLRRFVPPGPAFAARSSACSATLALCTHLITPLVFVIHFTYHTITRRIS